MKNLIVSSLFLILISSIKTVFGDDNLFLYCQYWNEGSSMGMHETIWASQDAGIVGEKCGVPEDPQYRRCISGHMAMLASWSYFGCESKEYYVAKCAETLNSRTLQKLNGTEIMQGCGHKTSGKHGDVLCIKAIGDDGCTGNDKYYNYNNNNKTWEQKIECPTNCNECDDDGKCITTTATTTTNKTTTSTTSTTEPNISTTSITEPTTFKRCGEGYEKCPSGQCCSKDGYCGSTDVFCSTSKGCQSEFGECRCGTEFGSCPNGLCCSRFGWCGSDSDYCSTSKGCQSEFGECRCGKKFGLCPNGLCCSKFGWCGSDSNYCSANKGCQSKFGECRCGNDEFGSCPNRLCCSKYGWCGSDSNYCSTRKGCQSKYGKCK